MKRFLRRLTALVLGLLLCALPACAEGAHFSLRVRVEPDSAPEELQQLLAGVALLLEAAEVQGTLTTEGDRFHLDADLLVGSGSSASVTDFDLRGMSTHWSLRSSLLGDEELMIRCGSILPFGMKANDYLGLPLDKAALTIPAVHGDALASVVELLSPLFPSEETRFTLTRAEMDAVIRELRRLCDEDPALSRYLEVTGLYATVVNFCDVYMTIPVFILPSLNVRRSGSTITWTSGILSLLFLSWEEDSVTARFTLPTVVEVLAEASEAGGLLSGSASITMDDMTGSASFSLPVEAAEAETPVLLRVDAESHLLPEGEIHLNLAGQAKGNDVTLSWLSADGSRTFLTVTGTVEPRPSDPLPPWTAEDMTGFDVLSVNSDSLRRLMGEIRWPLMSGVFDLVVAAPAPAVQTLMDYAEDSGLIDLLTDMLSGGSGY